MRVVLLVMSLLLSTQAFAAEAPQPQERLAYVTVAGAPGDGEQALTKALYDALAPRGVKPASFTDTSVYEIEVLVRVEPESKTMQKVTINWIVFDVEGNTLGHVSQKKSVRKGSLDKRWGPAAKAAAGAAAGEIMDLIQKK